jgi:predicted Zn-dependent protease
LRINKVLTVALILLVAGYDPWAAISLWQKMQQAGGSRPSQFLSTHPPTETRLVDLKAYAERVMALHRQVRR